MSNSPLFTDCHVYKYPTLTTNQIKDPNIFGIGLGVINPRENVFRGTETKQCPPPPTNSPFGSQLYVNESRDLKLPDPFDLMDHQKPTTSSENNNLSGIRYSCFSPPPPMDTFRRPSCPLYYPSHHHSYTSGPYKRPSSSPLYLITEKDYCPAKTISQNCRRRRSTTPPHKEIKHLSTRIQLLQSRRNSNNDIWSIPREV